MNTKELLTIAKNKTARFARAAAGMARQMWQSEYAETIRNEL